MNAKLNIDLLKISDAAKSAKIAKQNYTPASNTVFCEIMNKYSGLQTGLTEMLILEGAAYENADKNNRLHNKIIRKMTKAWADSWFNN